MFVDFDGFGETETVFDEAGVVQETYYPLGNDEDDDHYTDDLVSSVE
jgi:hypothetical protein